MKTEFGNAYKNGDGYWVISGGKHRGKLYHRLVVEKFYNIKLPDDWDVHHDDENKDNNEIWNLIPMPRSEHMSLHNKGEKNPMHGKKHSPETKQKISDALKKLEPRIVENGIVNGKQNWALYANGEYITGGTNLERIQKEEQRQWELWNGVQTTLTDKEVEG